MNFNKKSGPVCPARRTWRFLSCLDHSPPLAHMGDGVDETSTRQARRNHTQRVRHCDPISISTLYSISSIAFWVVPGRDSSRVFRAPAAFVQTQWLNGTETSSTIPLITPHASWSFTRFIKRQNKICTISRAVRDWPPLTPPSTTSQPARPLPFLARAPLAGSCVAWLRPPGRWFCPPVVLIAL